VKSVSEKEVVFDYSNNSIIISVLKPLVGKSGVLKVSNYSIESFDKEDYVLISAIDESGNPIDSEVAKKLFSISGRETNLAQISKDQKNKIDELENLTINDLSTNIAQRNSDFFENEVDKLDKWSDDVKKALELDLRKLDIDIKTAKTNAKKILILEEKLKVHREIKDMEKRCNEMRKRLFEEQDNVETKKEQLIDKVQLQLNQSSRLIPIFTICWRVV